MYPNVRALIRDVARRLRRGEHLVLYGARGSGKSTVLAELATRMRNAGITCTLCASTHRLDDITGALAEVYPVINTSRFARHTGAGELWRAPDLKGGVLLLDHLTDVTDSMVDFLDGLYQIVGVLSAVDTDLEEHGHINPSRLGKLSARMPPASLSLLQQLLQERCSQLKIPVLGPGVERQLLRASLGRPGWILQCASLLNDGRYWRGHQLLMPELCSDTEAALRLLGLNLRGADGRKEDSGSQ